MAQVPSDPLICHITHVQNLPSILAEDGLWSDSQCIARGIGNTNIGHLHIKQRRLQRRIELPPRGMLGDYVPFNFCSRSVMLYVVSRGHQDYAGGQEEIIHLVSRVSTIVASGRPWLFTNIHAELGYAQYYASLDDLREVPWHVMGLRHWSKKKKERQAEFLVHQHVPWSSILGVGVKTPQVRDHVLAALQAAGHETPVEVFRQWYY